MWYILVPVEKLCFLLSVIQRWVGKKVCGEVHLGLYIKFNNYMHKTVQDEACDVTCILRVNQRILRGFVVEYARTYDYLPKDRTNDC